MAMIQISIADAEELYRVARMVNAADSTLTVDDLKAAVVKAGNAVARLCEIIEPWTPGRSNNLVMAGVGWKVSYKIASDSGEPETALLNIDTGQWYMLDGDHRAAYESARHAGLAGLLNVYEELKATHPHGGGY